MLKIFPTRLASPVFKWYSIDMEIKRTIPIIVNDTPALKALVKEYNRYQRTISPIAFNDGDVLSAVDLHNAVYHHVPAELSAQMKCSAIRSVIGAYTSARSNGRPAERPFVFRKASALFLYGRDCRFLKHGGLFSISVLGGRAKLAYHIPSYAQDDFNNAKSYDSVTVTGDGKVRLCITLEVPEPSGDIPVGIDLGATNALVASTANDTLFISGKRHKVRNRKTRKVRQRLQKKLTDRKALKKDTRSIRRVLKRLGRRNSNRSQTFCKETAAKLCKWIPENSVLVFEDLRVKQVRKGRRNRSGTNRKLSQWFYDMMIRACTNRAERDGIAIAFINPAYTSQKCSKCGQLGERWGHSFKCSCGHNDHADINASHNVRLTFTVLRSSGLQSTSPEALAYAEGKPLASC